MESFLLIFINFYALSILFAQQFCLVNCSIPYLQQPVYDDEGNVKFFPRIVGGRKARDGDVRSIVSIQTWRGAHICGGTWYQNGNQSHILTAAHCVKDKHGNYYPKYLLQVMGDDLSISISSPGANRQIRSVRKIVAHSSYVAKTLENDIAIIFLKTPFKETSTFSPISIASENIFDGQSCSIAGWGYLEENGPQQSVQLMVANVTVISRKICNGKDSYRDAVGKNAFCAGSTNGGTDSCQGDSGGGIFSKNNLIGIVSFGVGCGRKEYPGVYTNVYNYKQWILANSSSIIVQSHFVMLITIFTAIFAQSIF